jgi:hypothetical protein
MKSCRPVIVASLMTTLLSVPSLAGDADKEPSLKDVLTRLETVADRIAELDQRILRLERILVKPVRVDKNGIIRNARGRPVGVWGIDTDSRIVPKR